jgi:hypothetical protein
MPTYIVHGFRWPRAAIRIHIILFDLEDAAAEWIVAPASAITILNSFYTLYDFLPPSQPPVASTNLPPSPGLLEPPNAKNERAAGGASSSRKGSDGTKKALKFNDWSVVKLLEHYDPEDESCTSQPYAYVADYIIPVSLSLDIGAEMAAYEEKQRAEAQPLLSPTVTSPTTEATLSTNGTSGAISTSLSEREMKRKSRRLGWFEKLRDQLAKEASIGWYVVVCGDEQRTVPDLSGLSINVKAKGEDDELRAKTPRSAGIRGFFGKKDRRPSGSTEEK